MNITRTGNTITISIPAGAKAGGFARFLERAADAFEAGKLLPSNRSHNGNIVKAADEIRAMAKKVHDANA